MTTVDRVRFVPGAALTARDLKEELHEESTSRALHVRTVHGTWGVGIGYSVGALGRWLVVGPGLAYDCRGRELLSSRTVALEPPRLPESSTEAWFDLAIRHFDDRALRFEETLCSPARRERPRFVWTTAGDDGSGDADVSSELRLGEAVPLARVCVGENGITGVSLGHRRGARTLARTRVAAGRAPVVVPDDGTLTSTHAIDTSGGGFQSEPLYFVSLSPCAVEKRSALDAAGLLGPLLSVSSPSATGFTLTIRFAATEQTSFGEPSELFADWVGIEPNRGCCPPVRPTCALVDAGIPIAPLDSALAMFVAQPQLSPMVKSLEETPS